MARASLTTADILEINGGKIDTFVLIDPSSLDPDDVELFVVKPPPAVRDLAHRAPIGSMSDLCDNCRGALEYCSYFFRTAKSGGKDALEGLPRACLLHAGAKSLKDGDEAGCHLCVLVSTDLRAKRLKWASVDESNIEMSWQYDEGKPLERIHIALTHNGHPRSAENYWNILKLKLWPADEFGPSLFGLEESSEFELHGSTASSKTRGRAIEWLSRCQANEDGRHTQCNQGPQDWLPTRLLDVTHALETSSLRLVTPASEPDAFVSDRRYMTLSHCWGAWGATELPILTTQNLDERQISGLDVSLLPQTFKDALDVANWFQVRWLWIDSLCILQDSRDDWEKEAVMMYDVYKGAVMNISADDSNDARWGCFRNRHPLSTCPMRLKFLWEDSDASTYWLTPDSKSLFDNVTKAPLARRAWVFQERQLSRRILHFTSNELIWECCASGQHFASESFPDGAPFRTIFNNKTKFQGDSDLTSSSPAELYTAWDKLCLAYSEKELSHGVDKAVALSGLAQEFEAALPRDSYVCGLWHSTIPQSLLWVSSYETGRFETDNFIAPSWSWLSMEGRINDMGPRDAGSSLVEIISVITEPAILSKPTASLRSAFIELLCYLCPVEIKPDYKKKPWYMMAIGGGQQHQLIVNNGGRTVDLGSDRCFSFDLPWGETFGPSAVSGYFLPILTEQPSELTERVIRGLLVEQLDGDLKAFRRIGTLNVRGSHCVAIGYKRKDDRENPTWQELETLLRPSFESGENLRKKGEQEAAMSKGVSALAISENETEDPEGNNFAAEENGPAVEDSRVAEETLKTIDLEPLGALERFYASDTAFDGSELEAAFERLSSEKIRLI